MKQIKQREILEKLEENKYEPSFKNNEYLISTKLQSMFFEKGTMTKNEMSIEPQARLDTNCNNRKVSIGRESLMVYENEKTSNIDKIFGRLKYIPYKKGNIKLLTDFSIVNENMLVSEYKNDLTIPKRAVGSMFGKGRDIFWININTGNAKHMATISNSLSIEKIQEKQNKLFQKLDLLCNAKL